MSHAFDPELVPITEMLPHLPYNDPPAFRQQAAEFSASMLPRPETAVPVEVRDVAVPGPAGAPDVPVRIYIPKSGQGASGAFIYIHGGGWIGGDVAGNDGLTYTLAAETGAVVLSVEYRLAPENPFPAAPEDCYAAFLWTVENAAELGIDPERIAIGGDSAGANLSAGVSLMARDRGGPTPCFQLLRVPAFDDRLDTRSVAELNDTPILGGTDLPFVWDFYLGGPGRRGGPDVSPYAAPARAEDLTGLPPAYICVAEFDPLRDEAIAYAQRLLNAGVPTELHLVPGTFHGSHAIPGPKINALVNAEAVTVIQRALKIEQ
ncbi:alpha/beta hydrolase [Streptomyces sp. NPDC002680]|uniref:alpha/beta hydrolase n=1 Tax=Streptomyces sp. NPDC002680 TaxID=3364659 RepID=UPI003690E6D2